MSTVERQLAAVDLPLLGLVAPVKSAVAVPLTGTLLETVLATVPYIGGSIGLNGLIRVLSNWSANNSAGAKTVRVRLGGLTGGVMFSAGMTTGLLIKAETIVQNRNSASSQFLASYRARGSDGLVDTNFAAPTTVNTAINQSLVFTGQLAVGTDTLTLESYLVEYLK